MGLQTAQEALEKLLVAVPMHDGVLPNCPSMGQQHNALASLAHKMQNEREKGHTSIAEVLQAFTEVLLLLNLTLPWDWFLFN